MSADDAPDSADGVTEAADAVTEAADGVRDSADAMPEAADSVLEAADAVKVFSDDTETAAVALLINNVWCLKRSWPLARTVQDTKRGRPKAAFFFFSRWDAARLPNLAAVGAHHRVARFAAEGLRELRHIGDRAVDAEAP